ncbi:ferredoxin reductase family protein [Yersinia intermedia]|uniref:FAD-binding FR-type domain-containing protein n=1 Tax=Yersinia intermedia TaxID=631 RepID=A0A208ZI66_YERIN|nr:ferric reductase-like transmembrane domain-containing protein [Yersinia intermedia]OVZ80155.1 hypothetical protein CBW57_22925 [Yersinia intermedia]CNC65074.1 putative dioxygenase subunit beta [Yersinia intermedia]CRF15704.1 putative dioxygenase subunit beta [Yersinia intermedia]
MNTNIFKGGCLVSNRMLLWIGGALTLSVSIYLLSGCWHVLLDGAGFMVWRRQIILLSGIIAWVLMTACMVIALRPLWLDKLMGGIDKAYGVHKWSGITVTVMLVLHWLMYEGPKWLVNWGWLALGRRQGGNTEFAIWEMLAKPVGKWTFYAFIVMAVLALVKFLPYWLFSKVHKVFPIIYLAGAYHAVVILPAGWWSSPAAYIIVALTIVGSYAAVVSLLQKIGKSRTVQAVVTQVQRTASGIVDVSIKLVGGQRMPHLAGQFVFVDFGLNHEGHHPFTIASADPQVLRFAIKPQGDFTSQLGDLLKPGQAVQVEGPYGQFNFNSSQPHQIWVAGGIGIAPFMARLEKLATNDGKSQNVDFWYCTCTTAQNQFPPNLDTLCIQSGVRLHRIIDEWGQQLSPKSVLHVVQDISRTSVWFCGPSGFAKALRSEFTAMGLNDSDFHVERFEMR